MAPRESSTDMPSIGDTRKRKRAAAADPLAVKKLRLLDSRQKLPIWARRKDLQDALRKNDVLVLSGETGSGKSTQVPQFLVDQKWCTGKIAVTQPRRVAAITLARRVADEMGTPCGKSSPASKVGYSVRFDDSTSPSTKIKFLTEGMLLQEMLRDTDLKQYSCVVVDEVHERSVNVDLILGFLKNLLGSTTRKDKLKVVIMSATADVDAISQFFSSSNDGEMPVHNSKETEAVGNLPAGNLRAKETTSKAAKQHGHVNGTSQSGSNVSRCHVEGRQYSVTLRYLDSPTEDLLESALHRIFKLHCKEPMPGDILVFMTGQEAIQSLQKLVEEYAEMLTHEFPKLLVLPLFAALPQPAQQRIFEPPPRFTRKVILSTNIAETSVTVPGVRFVIDTGKAKVRRFHNRLGLESLLVKSISKSSADQRKGRAGREAPGQCYRLYTQEGFGSLEKDNKPEVLMCDLSQAILNLKARGVDDVLSFPYITPPPRRALEKALLQLLQLGALEETGKISQIGRQLARLPLTPSLGRVVVEAAKRDCLSEVIDIVSCLSVENIFLGAETEESREKAQTARQQLFRRAGDHLTLLAAVQGYSSETSDRRRWAEDHLISHRAMKNVMATRKQLQAQCQTLFASTAPADSPSNTTTHATMSSNDSEARDEAILKAFLYGFMDNIARLRPDGSYKSFVGNHTVLIHPSSVLFGRKVEAIMYNEFVYTNKAYARGVSSVQLRWMDEWFDAKLGQ